MIPTTQEILDIVSSRMTDLRRFGVRSIALVGSFARGEQTEESDLDFLVEFEKKDFEAFMDLVFFLEELLGRDVDLITADSVRGKRRLAILEDAINVQGL